MFRHSYCKTINLQFAQKMIGKVKLDEFLTLFRSEVEGKGDSASGGFESG